MDEGVGANHRAFVGHQHVGQVRFDEPVGAGYHEMASHALFRLVMLVQAPASLGPCGLVYPLLRQGGRKTSTSGPSVLRRFAVPALLAMSGLARGGATTKAHPVLYALYVLFTDDKPGVFILIAFGVCLPCGAHVVWAVS